MTDRAGGAALHRGAQIEHYIGRMSSLSTTVTKVIEVCNDPASSPNDLGRVISLDPVLVGKVLNLINSAYYALPAKVTSMTRALVLLGLNTVKNLALSTAVLHAMGGKESLGHLPMETFWAHCLCVGVAAKAIAGLRGVAAVEREEYFIAGLLHDLGKVPLGRVFPDEYETVLTRARAEGISLLAAEAQILETTHTHVGEMIARKWHLDGTIASAMGHHHDPPVMIGEAPLTAVVALANLYATAAGIGSAGDNAVSLPVRDELLALLELEWHQLESTREAVLADIEKARVFLTVTGERSQ